MDTTEITPGTKVDFTRSERGVSVTRTVVVTRVEGRQVWGRQPEGREFAFLVSAIHTVH